MCVCVYHDWFMKVRFRFIYPTNRTTVQGRIYINVKTDFRTYDVIKCQFARELNYIVRIYLRWKRLIIIYFTDSFIRLMLPHILPLSYHEIDKFTTTEWSYALLMLVVKIVNSDNMVLWSSAREDTVREEQFSRFTPKYRYVMSAVFTSGPSNLSRVSTLYK